MKLFHPIGFMLASPVQTTAEAIARFTEEIKAELGPAANASETENSVILSEASESLRPLLERNKQSSRESNGPAFRSSVLKAAQLEDKYDGIRAQLHVAPVESGQARVALYSRNRDDLSESFPDLVEAFSPITEPAILDGEILAWNPAAHRALSFSALQQRLGRKRVTQEMLRDIPVVLVVFDILYRGETLLLNEPLIERRATLEDFAARWSPATASTQARGQSHLFEAQQDPSFPRLILANATRLETPRLSASAQLDQAYLDARARGNEGVMIKSLASTYQPGRRGLAWLKLKRELATLDVVVTGVEYGNGRRAHVLSDYTFAISDPDDPAQPLKNVGKAYSGLTDQEIADMTAFFKAHTLEDNGHFRTVEPTIVLEVAFNNVMRSTRHASGFALRFPRILRIRTDKPVNEIDTLQRVEEIYNSQPDKPIDDPEP
jgi:DNA ligase-1